MWKCYRKYMYFCFLPCSSRKCQPLCDHKLLRNLTVLFIDETFVINYVYDMHRCTSLWTYRRYPAKTSKVNWCWWLCSKSHVTPHFEAFNEYFIIVRFIFVLKIYLDPWEEQPCSISHKYHLISLAQFQFAQIPILPIHHFWGGQEKGFWSHLLYQSL